MREPKIDHTNAICSPIAVSESRNVQWVGITTHTSKLEYIFLVFSNKRMRAVPIEKKMYSFNY